VNKQINRFTRDGYVVLDDLLSPDEIGQIDAELTASMDAVDGDRRFLDREWCRLLAHVVRHRLLKHRLLYRATQPVSCVYFDTNASPDRALLRRELHLPMAARFDSPRWANWSDQQGIPYAQAPRDLLASMLAVRIHVDVCEGEEGALAVVPGSQTSADVNASRVSCAGLRGGAIVLSPMLLRAPICSGSGHRCRVLHFLFGPSALPDGASWYYAT
jgi:hypothetical protein